MERGQCGRTRLLGRDLYAFFGTSTGQRPRTDHSSTLAVTSRFIACLEYLHSGCSGRTHVIPYCRGYSGSTPYGRLFCAAQVVDRSTAQSTGGVGSGAVVERPKGELEVIIIPAAAMPVPESNPDRHLVRGCTSHSGEVEHISSKSGTRESLRYSQAEGAVDSGMEAPELFTARMSRRDLHRHAEDRSSRKDFRRDVLLATFQAK